MQPADSCKVDFDLSWQDLSQWALSGQDDMDFRSSPNLAKPLHRRHGLTLVGGHEVGEFVDYNIHVGPVIKPLSAALHGIVTVPKPKRYPPAPSRAGGCAAYPHTR